MDALILEPQEGANSQTDVVALGNFEAKLSALNAGERLEVAMIGFNRPGRLGGRLAMKVSHGQEGGGSVFRVAVCVNGPKDFDQSIARQMQDTASRWDGHFRNGQRLTGQRTDDAVAFQAGHPFPPVTAQVFEVVQTAVPTVKSDQRRAKTTCLRKRYHRPKMVVFVQAIVDFIVDAMIDGQTALAVIRPQQPNQGDALHHPMMFPRPMVADQRHFARIRLVQCTVINNQHAPFTSHTAFHFSPQPIAIRRIRCNSRV